MTTPPSPGFGSLLRQYRRTAGLTQEELAERAGLGRATIDALERRTRQTPRKETVALLADALALKESERVLFEAAAREHRRDSQPIFTSSSASEPLEITPAAESGASAEAAPTQGLRVLGKQVARLMSSKRATGLVSGLLVVVLLVGALVFKGTPLVSTLARQQPRTLCLATDFALTVNSDVDGAFASMGLSFTKAVQLAVQQNQHLGSGYTLTMINYDETPEYSAVIGQNDLKQGSQHMTDMLGKTCVVGMVGPDSSYVAAAEMPLAANAGLVMISPDNTSPGLTIREDAPLYGYDFDQLHPAGKKLNYFRTVANDAFQGREIADFTSRQLVGLGARSAFVVDDRTAYGELLAGGFTQEFLSKGGTIVGTDGIPFGGASRIAELAAKIVVTRPEVVLYGGQNLGGDGGMLKAQLVRAGYTGDFVSGDGIAGDPDFIARTGASAANNVYAIKPVPDLEHLTTGAAATFLQAYYAAYPDQDLAGNGSYALYAYDAAMVLITAIKHLIGAGQQVTRAAMIDRVQHTQYAGVTGPISFDANGDISHGVFSIYMVQDGNWVWVKQESV